MVMCVVVAEYMSAFIAELCVTICGCIERLYDYVCMWLYLNGCMTIRAYGCMAVLVCMCGCTWSGYMHDHLCMLLYVWLYACDYDCV